MKRRIILASSSVQRKAMLETLNIPFICISSDIDEKAIQDRDPKKRVEKIARAKGEKVAGSHKGIIIAADFFNVCHGRILEKPNSIEEAAGMLKFLGGESAVGYSGFYYFDQEKNIDFSTSIAIHYKFRKLSKSEIENYVKSYPVKGWAAGFAICDAYTSTFITYINGSLTGFTHALPMEVLIPLLKKSGIFS